MGPNRPRSTRMRLGNVVRGRVPKPLRAMIYGPVGVGKSTFAAAAPAPIFIGAEDGTSELDVDRFPQPQSWSDVEDAVADLLDSDHPYKTLVADTLDWLEPHAWSHVCEHSRDGSGKPYKSITAFPFGKGYSAALDLWRKLLADLETLRERKGMSIILLAHTQISTFANPEGDDYDRYGTKLHRKTAGLVREWVDAVLFAHYETYTVTTDGQTKAITTGARMLATQHAAGFDAKNRYDLPERLPLDWQTFAEAMERRPTAVQAALEAELAKAGDEVRARVRKKLETIGPDNLTELQRITIHLAALNKGTQEP